MVQRLKQPNLFTYFLSIFKKNFFLNFILLQIWTLHLKLCGTRPDLTWLCDHPSHKIYFLTSRPVSDGQSNKTDVVREWLCVWHLMRITTDSFHSLLIIALNWIISFFFWSRNVQNDVSGSDRISGKTVRIIISNQIWASLQREVALHRHRCWTSWHWLYE